MCWDNDFCMEWLLWEDRDFFVWRQWFLCTYSDFYLETMILVWRQWFLCGDSDFCVETMILVWSQWFLCWDSEFCMKVVIFVWRQWFWFAISLNGMGLALWISFCWNVFFFLFVKINPKFRKKKWCLASTQSCSREHRWPLDPGPDIFQMSTKRGKRILPRWCFDCVFTDKGH